MYITGLKKTAKSLEVSYQILELDEMYWFLERKARTETRENVYLMTMVSRLPRQIVDFDVAYPGHHIRNVNNKNDTFTVEGVNADLRHYIPILARRSRCFARKIDTLRAVLEVFVEAYIRFGVAKMNFRQNRDPKSRELPFSLLDFF